MTKVICARPSSLDEPLHAKHRGNANGTEAPVNIQSEWIANELYARSQCAKLISAVTTDHMMPRMETPKGVSLNRKIVKEFAYGCDALRVQTAEDGRGTVTVAVAGPFSLRSVLRLLADIEREVVGEVKVLLLDLSHAVMMFGLDAAVSLCEQCTGIALLRLPIVVVAPWSDAESNSRYQLESANRGVIRRVFYDVPAGWRWIQSYLRQPSS